MIREEDDKEINYLINGQRKRVWINKDERELLQ